MGSRLSGSNRFLLNHWQTLNNPTWVGFPGLELIDRIDYFIAASISSAEYGTPGVSNSAPSLVMMYMSSRKNPWPSIEAIGSKLMVVPGLSGPTGLAAIRFVVCTCQYGTFLRSNQKSIACCASRLFGGWPIFALHHCHRGCPILAFFARVGGDAACAIRIWYVARE